jgi:hypothetical protein
MKTQSAFLHCTNAADSTVLPITAACGLLFDGYFGITHRDHAEQQRTAKSPIAAPSGMKVKNTSAPL